MKIKSIKFDKIKVKLKQPFVVALGIVEYCETIIIKIETDEGIVGYGESCPLGFVTGELLETVPEVLKLFSSQLIGQDPFAIEKIHTIMDRLMVGNTSAKAGIDIALYDIMAKASNVPLYKFLGGMDNNVHTDMTISIDKPEIMAQQALDIVNNGGYKILKIKAGINPANDIEAIRMIREAVGNSIRLRVDANQGWDVNTAISTMKAFEKYNVEAVEQPLPFWDIDGAAIVRKASKISVMLDESVHTPEDALKIIKKEAADSLNIKLMKSSGLYPALKINSIAESSGVNCMVGCMIETKLALTASASLAAAQKNITEADVDSFLYFDDNSISGGFTLENGVATLLDKPGLGIDINF